MIHITPSALQEIKRLQHSQGYSRSYFRLGVKPGGCLDYHYTLALTQDLQDGDQEYETGGVVIVIDPVSASLIDNLKVDYAEDLMGGGFRFANPQATSTCSCSLFFCT